MDETEFYTPEDARRIGLRYGQRDAERDARRTDNGLGMLAQTARWVTDHMDDTSEDQYRRIREEAYLLAYVTTWARLAAKTTHELTEGDK